MSKLKPKKVSPTLFAESALYHRTLEVIYDLMQEWDVYPTEETREGLHRSLQVLTLIARRNPNHFKLPIILTHIYPTGKD